MVSEKTEVRGKLHDQAGGFVSAFRGTIVAVYDLDSRHRIEHIGTATLFQVGKRRFAASAKHVLDRLATRSLALAGEGLIEIATQQYFHTVTGSRGDDPFDISFVELSTAQVDEIGQCRFLLPSDCAAVDRTHLIHPKRSHYFALGFPCSLQEQPAVGERHPPASLVIQILAAQPWKYGKLAVPAQHHLLLDFDRKDVSGITGPLTAPKLNGMSGCGIWTAPRAITGSSTAQSLVAILIEYHAQSTKVIVGTRVGVLFDGIAKFFPDTRNALGVSP